jgi:hypothetical protein
MTVLVFTGLYGVLFSNLVFFSIPETYSLANVGILVFFLLIIRCRGEITKKRAIILGVASGVGALANPPLGLFAVFDLRAVFTSADMAPKFEPLPVGHFLGAFDLLRGKFLSVRLGLY